MKNRLKQILIWTVLVGYTVTALSMTAAERKAARVDAVSVSISDNSHNKFISEADIIQALENEHINIIGMPAEEVDIHHIEDVLRQHNKSVSSAEVYRTVYGNIGVRVEQRQPVMRIINQNGDSYYIDRNGQVMPLSRKYTAHVIVASGYINEPYIDHVGEDLKHMANNGVKPSGELLPDLFSLVRFINNDKLWRSQFEQIYIGPNGDIELIPRIGNHTIVLGNIDNMEEKFENLRAFYEQGLSRYGWNNYRTISLKYKNQIICTKRS